MFDVGSEIYLIRYDKINPSRGAIKRLSAMYCLLLVLAKKSRSEYILNWLNHEGMSRLFGGWVVT